MPEESLRGKQFMANQCCTCCAGIAQSSLSAAHSSGTGQPGGREQGSAQEAADPGRTAVHHHATPWVIRRPTLTLLADDWQIKYSSLNGRQGYWLMSWHLYSLPLQVSTVSAGGCPADLDTISEELFRQLSSGQTVNVAGLLKSAAQSNAAGGSLLMSRHTDQTLDMQVEKFCTPIALACCCSGCL